MLGQGFSSRDLHREEADLVVLAELVDGSDVGMTEARQDPRLALEAGESVRIGDEGLGQYLDGDFATEPFVLGAVHLPHPSLTELAGDTKMAESRAQQHPG